MTKDFNPRSRVGNDSLSGWDFKSKIEFQSTFPRGERHRPYNRLSSFWLISIHVPAWGTTTHLLSWHFRNSYFNPRSRVGNDKAPSIFSPFALNFNPRSRVGNDCKFSQIFFVFLCNKYNFSTFYYPFSLFFSVIHVTFLIFVVRILPAFYVYF